jgi:hypothetical protein
MKKHHVDIAFARNVLLWPREEDFDESNRLKDGVLKWENFDAWIHLWQDWPRSYMGVTGVPLRGQLEFKLL